MTIIPLGIGSAQPTLTRHTPATVVQHDHRLLLFDCGEGTQLRLAAARLRHSKIDAIFITHLHGDHYFGLMGLLNTMALCGRRSPLVVVGPEALMQVMGSVPGISPEELTFAMEYVPVTDTAGLDTVYESRNLLVRAHGVDHRVTAFGYRVEQKVRPGRLNVERAREWGVTTYESFRRLKSRKSVRGSGGQTVTPDMVLGPSAPTYSFAYSGDTQPCEGVLRLANGVDLLMHEATFAEDLAQKAADTKHSTGRQAAVCAREANAKKLLLTHFSSRYKTVELIEREAQEVFPAAEAARELYFYSLSAVSSES